MGRWLIVLVSLVLWAGCARPSRKGVLSPELPLTLSDLAEIRDGEKNHETILLENIVLRSPKLENYLNAMAASLSEVSTRPHLPYKVVILEGDEVMLFGGPGGYIYMTRGLLEFVGSEAELAGIVAHEIGHISHYDYANIPKASKMKTLYDKLLQGSELASEAVGSYGTAANRGLKGVGRVTPIIANRFRVDQEIGSDERAIDYLMKAGYDPRGLYDFLERLSRVEISEIPRFVGILNTHPPFQDRREVLREYLNHLNLDTQLKQGKIEFKKDLLNDVRQAAFNVPNSILFEPESGLRRTLSSETGNAPHAKENKLVPAGQRGEWF